MALKIRHFTKSVTTAGTREVLTPSNILAHSFSIQAKAGNGGQIYIGDENVSSTSCGVELDSSENVSLSAELMGHAGQVVNLNTIWLDTSNSGDGVWVLYTERVE